MKPLLAIIILLAGTALMSSSCKQHYICMCSVTDTAVSHNSYSSGVSSGSAGTAQCKAIQAQHAGDTCFVQVEKD